MDDGFSQGISTAFRQSENNSRKPEVVWLHTQQEDTLKCFPGGWRVAAADFSEKKIGRS